MNFSCRADAFQISHHWQYLFIGSKLKTKSFNDKQHDNIIVSWNSNFYFL